MKLSFQVRKRENCKERKRSFYWQKRQKLKVVIDHFLFSWCKPSKMANY